jgi:hypothetical protein
MGINQMIANELPGPSKPEIGKPRENSSLAGNGVGKHVIKSGNAIAGNDQEMTMIYGVNVTDLALAQERGMNCRVHYLPPFKQKTKKGRVTLQRNATRPYLFPAPLSDGEGLVQTFRRSQPSTIPKKASSRLSRTGHKHVLQRT